MSAIALAPRKQFIPMHVTSEGGVVMEFEDNQKHVDTLCLRLGCEFGDAVIEIPATDINLWIQKHHQQKKPDIDQKSKRDVQECDARDVKIAPLDSKTAIVQNTVKSSTPKTIVESSTDTSQSQAAQWTLIKSKPKPKANKSESKTQTNEPVVATRFQLQQSHTQEMRVCEKQLKCKKRRCLRIHGVFEPNQDKRFLAESPKNAGMTICAFACMGSCPHYKDTICNYRHFIQLRPLTKFQQSTIDASLKAVPGVRIVRDCPKPTLVMTSLKSTSKQQHSNIHTDSQQNPPNIALNTVNTLVVPNALAVPNHPAVPAPIPNALNAITLSHAPFPLQSQPQTVDSKHVADVVQKFMSTGLLDIYNINKGIVGVIIDRSVYVGVTGKHPWKGNTFQIALDLQHIPVISFKGTYDIPPNLGKAISSIQHYGALIKPIFWIGWTYAGESLTVLQMTVRLSQELKLAMDAAAKSIKS